MVPLGRARRKSSDMGCGWKGHFISAELHRLIPGSTDGNERSSF